MAYRLLKGEIIRAIFPLMGVIVGARSLILSLFLGDGAKKIIDREFLVKGTIRVLVGGGFIANNVLDRAEK